MGEAEREGDKFFLLPSAPWTPTGHKCRHHDRQHTRQRPMDIALAVPSGSLAVTIVLPSAPGTVNAGTTLLNGLVPLPGAGRWHIQRG